MQHDFFADGDLTLTPAAGRVEPRLWVRRLIIWEEPEKEIRSIELRPGLNVVWSPDDGSRQGQIGHGGGKTTFCRLLRYCLGEAGFGPDAQRRAVLDKIPASLVGAEVRLDGETWLIRRALGLPREDYAFRGSSFAEAPEFPAEPTGMKPFRDAATRALLKGALQLMPPSISDDDAWQALLAWMTRDQECRFGHLLDWRSPDSGSHSPVSGRNRPQEDRLAVVRVVIDALRAEELDASRRWQETNSRLGEQRSRINRLSWHLDRLRKRLTGELGFEVDKTSALDPAVMKTAAREKLAAAQNAPVAATLDQVHIARSNLEKAIEGRAQAQTAIEIANSSLENQELLVRILGDELPELSARNRRLANPVCPVCGVLIDKARAEGCGIALQDCDLDELNRRVEEKRDSRTRAVSEVANLRQELPRLQHELATVEQRLRERRDQLSRLETAMENRSRAMRQAERAVDLADEFEELAAEAQQSEAEIATVEKRLEAIGDELENHRSSVHQTVSRLSDRFNGVFREVVPTSALCSVKLDGHGLKLQVPVDGAAIDSLKIAVFDLAVLSMAIEGETRHPGLLVHDSPREADLGGSLYAGVFSLAKKLESFGPQPLFQYIMTTTTRPPGEFCSEPWLRLQLKGSPAEERLLKRDL